MVNFKWSVSFFQFYKNISIWNAIVGQFSRSAPAESFLLKLYQYLSAIGVFFQRWSRVDHIPGAVDYPLLKWSLFSNREKYFSRNAIVLKVVKPYKSQHGPNETSGSFNEHQNLSKRFKSWNKLTKPCLGVEHLRILFLFILYRRLIVFLTVDL